MGKLTISTAIFHSYGSLPEGKWWSIIDLLGFNGSYPRVNQHDWKITMFTVYINERDGHVQ